jgi:cytochrome c-type biogenesis protein CcmH/NrfG
VNRPLLDAAAAGPWLLPLPPWWPSVLLLVLVVLLLVVVLSALSWLLTGWLVE